jgi:hypothetical protein
MQVINGKEMLHYLPGIVVVLKKKLLTTFMSLSPFVPLYHPEIFRRFIALSSNYRLHC